MNGRRRIGRRWAAGGVAAAAVIAGTGLIVWSPWEEPPVFAWETCEAPSIDETRGFDDVGIRAWSGEPVVAEQFAGIDGATSMAFPPGSGVAFVTTKRGLLYSIDSAGAAGVAVDLTSEVGDGAEQGLLSVAFAPGGGFVYLTYTDLDGSVVLDEYGWDGTAFDQASRRTVRTIREPQEWHNGGHIEFGPDGYLYLGLGDGGSIGDRFRNGQELDLPYASILRFDPRPDGDQPYSIPSDNPYVGRSDAPATWVWGLRNPWKFSFDRTSGDLWIGDVGQNCVEEIDFVPAGSNGGENFGWSTLEGTYRFEGHLPDNHTLPLLEYRHDEGGCAITGGYVYRGSEIAELEGMYLFADYCRGKVFALDTHDGRAVALFELGIDLNLLTSFGEGPDGEIYFLTLQQGIWKLAAG